MSSINIKAPYECMKLKQYKLSDFVPVIFFIGGRSVSLAAEREMNALFGLGIIHPEIKGS